MSTDILDSKEAAELIGVTLATLKRWRGSGEGPEFFRLTGTPNSRVRYHREDIDAWIARQKNAQETK